MKTSIIIIVCYCVFQIIYDPLHIISHFNCGFLADIVWTVYIVCLTKINFYNSLNYRVGYLIILFDTFAITL